MIPQSHSEYVRASFLSDWTWGKIFLPTFQQGNGVLTEWEARLALWWEFIYEMWLWEDDRAKQQGMDFFKPPWVGGSVSVPGISDWPEHLTIWCQEQGQCVPPRPAGDHPINLCFSPGAPVDSCGCFPWILGRCPQNWGSEAYVSFLLRDTTINPLNSLWKLHSRTADLQGRIQHRVLSSPPGWEPDKNVLIQFIEVHGEAPVHPGENKSVGLGKSFPLM